MEAEGGTPFRFRVFHSILNLGLLLDSLNRVGCCWKFITVQAIEIVPSEGVQPHRGGAADPLALLAAVQLGAGRKEDQIPVGHIEIAQLPAQISSATRRAAHSGAEVRAHR